MTTDAGLPSGIDLSWVDGNTRPQDDLFGHVNGRWLAEHVIPDDRASDGAFRHLVDKAEEDVRVIIEESASMSGPDAEKVAALYQSFMDTDRVNALGSQPLKVFLDEIEAAKDRDELAVVLGSLQRRGLVALFGAFVSTDAKNSERYLLHVNQSGLGLPDESYYREDEFADIRSAYVDHLGALATLIGLAEPKNLAQQVMDLEAKLAAVSWDRVSNRDAEKTYTLMTVTQLAESAPQFTWSTYLHSIGAKLQEVDELVVRQPSFVTGAAELWESLPLEQWKQWMTVRVCSAAAPFLNDEVVEQNFSFYGRTLSGTPQLRERWKRGVSVVQSALGEAVGKLYVERHFPPSAKEQMLDLVGNLIAAYRESISNLDWMSEDTKQRALDKLNHFTPKIGYPEEWKDYSGLFMRPDDLFGNVVRADEWDTDFELTKLGRPVNRKEWFMTPRTVNAYFNPPMNEIVFPAAILQPPFFDPDVDDAANYGGIGAVIGHEIGHGFDDQGSRYDSSGNLNDWWEKADREEFDRRAKTLIEQYDKLSPAGVPDRTVNGALTVGENIGDLGGLTIAIKAYRISLEGREAPVIDGLSGLQRVLMAWAQVWRSKYRPEEAVRLLLDVHSPPNLRCNAVVTNLDVFHEVFGVTPEDALFTPEERRVRIW